MKALETVSLVDHLATQWEAGQVLVGSEVGGEGTVSRHEKE